MNDVLFVSAVLVIVGAAIVVTSTNPRHSVARPKAYRKPPATRPAQVNMLTPAEIECLKRLGQWWSDYLDLRERPPGESDEVAGHIANLQRVILARVAQRAHKGEL